MEGPAHTMIRPLAFSTKPEVPMDGIPALLAAPIIIGAGMILTAIGEDSTSSRSLVFLISQSFLYTLLFSLSIYFLNPNTILILP